MSFNARPYQIEAVEKIRDAYLRGVNSVFYTLATGGGKTHIFSDIISRSVSKNKNVWVIAHRKELVTQAVDKLNSHGVRASALTGGHLYKGIDSCTVSMVQTLASWHRSNKIYRLAPPDLIIVDEAHLATSPSYENIFNLFPKARKLLVSATPWRLDGRGFTHLAQELINGPQADELIEMGYLVKPITYTGKAADPVKMKGNDYDSAALQEASNTPELNGDVMQNYETYAKYRPFIFFGTGVQHSMNVKSLFESKGYRVAHVDGETPKEERAQILRDFEKGELDGLTNCSVFVEGLDVTRVSCVIVARRTKSLVFWKQAGGRGYRLHPDKKDCVILDCGGCVQEHGHLQEPKAWSLEPRKGEVKGKSKEDEEEKLNKQHCSACGFDFEGRKKEHKFCPFCGFPVSLGRDVQHSDEILMYSAFDKEDAIIRARYEKVRQECKAAGHRKFSWSAWYRLLNTLIEEGKDGVFLLNKALGPEAWPPSFSAMPFDIRADKYPSIVWSYQ